jgi:hypothetical protein
MTSDIVLDIVVQNPQLLHVDWTQNETNQEELDYETMFLIDDILRERRDLL